MKEVKWVASAETDCGGAFHKREWPVAFVGSKKNREAVARIDCAVGYTADLAAADELESPLTAFVRLPRIGGRKESWMKLSGKFGSLGAAQRAVAEFLAARPHYLPN